MPNKYNLGDTAYIVESAIDVREVKIHNITGDFYTLRFTDGKGGIKVRGSRLFPTREAAEATLPSASVKPYRKFPHPHLDEANIIKPKQK